MGRVTGTIRRHGGEAWPALVQVPVPDSLSSRRPVEPAATGPGDPTALGLGFSDEAPPSGRINVAPAQFPRSRRERPRGRRPA